MLRYRNREEILKTIETFELDPGRTQPVGNTYLCLYGFIPSCKYIELAVPGDLRQLVPHEPSTPMPTVHAWPIKGQLKVWLVGGVFTLYNASRLQHSDHREKTLGNLNDWGYGDLVHREEDVSRLLLEAPNVSPYNRKIRLDLTELFAKNDIPLTPEFLALARRRLNYDYFWQWAESGVNTSHSRRESQAFDELVKQRPIVGALFRALDVYKGNVK